MRKIIKNKNIAPDGSVGQWLEVEPRPQRGKGAAERIIRRLRADEKVNKYGIIYRIRTINA